MRANNSGRRGIKLNFDSDDFLLEFDTPSEEFIRGFECGEIWACLVDEVEYLQATVAASNALMIMRMADAAGYTFEAVELPSNVVEAQKLGPGEWMIVSMKVKND